MSELSEEEIARLFYEFATCTDLAKGPAALDKNATAFARAVLALLQPALERARVALTDEQDHLLMCAIENLRSAERNDRTVEAAWRMAEKMEAWRKAAAIRKG